MFYCKIHISTPTLVHGGRRTPNLVHSPVRYQNSCVAMWCLPDDEQLLKVHIYGSGLSKKWGVNMFSGIHFILIIFWGIGDGHLFR